MPRTAMSPGFMKRMRRLIADPAIAIVDAVDGSVELIVTPYRHEHQLPLPWLGGFERGIGMFRFSRQGDKNPLSNPIGKIESTRLSDPFCEVLKARQNPLDKITNAIVITCHFHKIKGRLPPEGRLCQSRYDHHFAQQIFRDRAESPLALVDDAH